MYTPALVSRSTKSHGNICTPCEVLRCVQDDREEETLRLIEFSYALERFLIG